MRVIFGLGNPGKKYETTRHNAGFIYLDFYADLLKSPFTIVKSKFGYAQGKLEGNDFLLVKPLTYMNLSGEIVSEILSKFQISIYDILVVYDDYNFDVGSYKINLAGGSGGHNGISSIIDELESKSFARIRLGIGKSFEQGAMVDFVLSKFTVDELFSLQKTFVEVSSLANGFITDGAKGLMNGFSKIQSLQKLKQKIEVAGQTATGNSEK